MDIHDASFEGAEEFPFEDAHEAGEDHQVDLGVAQGPDVGGLGLLIEFRAETSGWNEMGGQAALAGVLEDAGIGDIRNHDGDGGRDGAGGDGVGDGDEVGAFAGAEDAEAEGGVVGHAAG